MKVNVGAANHAQGWPSTPLATAATVAEIATADLLDLVVQAGYTGQAWAELQRRLVDRAFPDLEGAVRSGAIYLRCAHAGFKIPRRTELQVRPYPEEIAAEAVEDCLLRFRARVLPAGEWNPDQGTSLEDFFSACCLPDVANRWRWHLRRLPERSAVLDDGRTGELVALTLEGGLDPADTVEQRDAISQALAPMKAHDRTAFVLLAAGWSPEEIARTLGLSRNTFDARVSRARKAARARRAL